ncbi:SMa0974 family conjugal transfer regulator [Rhizobium fabae]|uniref:Uncharacterized protein n=1 Tax=Rhizobium fabae TaxID=573179 RepID=A0A7W6BAH0_9HYPH|nr:hypothetical protein [Rhizobium fabae]MBB3918625.1 hypothetical protein [Rhizobium fabae]
MYKHVSEAFVPIPRAEFVAHKVCARSSAYCRSIGANGTDTLLDFGDARAILTPTYEGLHFRVEALDIITLSGIRTLLQGSLSAITAIPGGAVEWHLAGSASFRAIRVFRGNGQSWPGGR